MKLCPVIQPQLWKLSLSHLVMLILHIELELDRYKFVVQVVIGELRGEGVK